MYRYRGLGYLGVLIPCLAVAALGFVLDRLGLGMKNTVAYSQLYWLFGLTFVFGGIAVFFLGRRVNGIQGSWTASFAKNRPRPLHALNGFSLENTSLLSIAIGVFIMGYWAVHHLR